MNEFRIWAMTWAGITAVILGAMLLNMKGVADVAVYGLGWFVVALVIRLLIFLLRETSL